MKIKKAYQFKLKVDASQAHQLLTYAGHCRFLWNHFLPMNLERLKNKQPIMRYNEMDYWSKLYKKSEERSFLSECPAHILQQKLKDLDRAFMDAFDKNQPNKKMPTPRKRAFHNSFRFPEPKQIQLDYNRIKLPKLGWLHFFRSQEIKGEIKNVTVSKKANDWTISIQVEQDIAPPVREATLSKNHAMIVIEDLKVSNMSRSAKGDSEHPGKNVSAKSGLNKSILDQGWSEFRRQLTYKLDWRGGVLVVVDPRHTSQECSACHHVAKENRQTQSEFKCVSCGFECHADLNASYIILAAGHAVLACRASA